MVAALPLFLVLALAACRGTSDGAPILEATTSRAVDDGDDPTVVAPDALSTPAAGARAPLVIVSVFTDYQCPNCKRLHDVAARVLEAWPDEVQVQFRMLPLQGHALARPAARVALAAHRQGRFLCMNAALTRARTTWTGMSEAGFLVFARDVLAPRCGLDGARLMADQEDPRIAAKIEAEVQLARDARVRGTPTVLVDGTDVKFWPVAGVRPELLLNAVVRRSLREAKTHLSECRARGEACPLDGLPAARLYGNLGDSELTQRLLDLN